MKKASRIQAHVAFLCKKQFSQHQLFQSVAVRRGLFILDGLWLHCNCSLLSNSSAPAQNGLIR